MDGKCNTNGEMRNLHVVSSENVKARDCLGDISVDGKVVSKCSYMTQCSLVGGY
jgi:hypothetical protein